MVSSEIAEMNSKLIWVYCATVQLLTQTGLASQTSSVRTELINTSLSWFAKQPRNVYKDLNTSPLNISCASSRYKIIRKIQHMVLFVFVIN